MGKPKGISAKGKLDAVKNLLIEWEKMLRGPRTSLPGASLFVLFCSFAWGKFNVRALGPEFSVGYVYDDPFIVSISTGAQLYGSSRGWNGYFKVNGAANMLGGSMGLSLNSIDNRIKLGVESDIWTGVLAYGMVSYRLIPGYSGISASGKIKFPNLIN